MPPKRRARVGSNSADLFHYSNQVELTFKSQPKETILAKAAENVDSSESEDDSAPILKKKGKRSVDTSSSESSSASDSEVDEVKEPTEDSQDVVCEIPDDDELGPRPLTPPPRIRNIATTGVSRQTEKLSRTVCDKMRYLQYLQDVAEQDTPSPVISSPDVVIVQDGPNFGTPTGANRKITIRIRTRNGVERFSLKRNDTFQVIFTELAKKHDVNVDALSLSFTDTQGNFQTLKGTDTPNSVNLNVADIIDCVVVHAESLIAAFENSDNTVNIKIQGSDSKTVKQFKALKNEPLGNIMQQYAEFRQLPLSKLRFSFDGETMTSEQSPNDLDMDEDNVVDVQIR